MSSYVDLTDPESSMSSVATALTGHLYEDCPKDKDGDLIVGLVATGLGEWVPAPEINRAGMTSKVATQNLQEILRRLSGVPKGTISDTYKEAERLLKYLQETYHSRYVPKYFSKFIKEASRSVNRLESRHKEQVGF